MSALVLIGFMAFMMNVKDGEHFRNKDVFISIGTKKRNKNECVT